MSDQTLYKSLTEDGRSPYQGYEWPLPEGGEPGEWVDAGEGELIECDHGIHACTVGQLPRWLDARIYVLEPAGGTDRIDGEDKTVLRRARLVRRVETWDETTARLYAADCAEMVLPIYEAEHPDDDRPRRAIRVTRAYARGEADREELRSARAAARDAAWAAARDAAMYAARAAAMYAAMYAARAAARDAAWAAASAAASAAAKYAAKYAARAAIADRLALYLERGEAAAEEPVDDIRDINEEADDE